MRAGLHPERLKRIAEMESGHFWFVGRWRLVERLREKHIGARRPRVVDVGCGTGRNAERLTAEGFDVVGLDRRREQLPAARGGGPQALFAQADATSLPFAPGAFGAALLLDVLEHVDDAALLSELHRVLAPGGLAFITVPAVPWLWSHRDDAAGHLRRYTRRTLEAALRASRLEVVEIRSYQCVLFPLVVLMRMLGRKRPLARDLEDRPLPALNALFTRINIAEVRLGDSVRLPWGSSLVAVGRRP